MIPIVSFWKSPRLAAWVFIVAVLVAAVRILFQPVAFIPHVLHLNPGIVLIPLFSAVWGPSGVIGSVLGFMVSDALTESASSLSFFRYAGVFMFGWTSQWLWINTPHIQAPGLGHNPLWKVTLRFLSVSLFSSIIYIVWFAWGCDMLKLYPFSYVAFWMTLHHVVMILLLGPALYRLMSRELVPHYGSWWEAMSFSSEQGCFRCKSGWLIISGALLAFVAGFMLSVQVDGFDLAQKYQLGTGGGWLLHILTGFFLVLHGAGLVICAWRKGRK